MIFTKERIVADVCRMLNVNCRPDPLAECVGSPQLGLAEIIEQLMPEAARTALLQAPLSDLDGRPFGEEVHWAHHCDGWVLLPDDFLRLVCFKMSDWSVAVSHPVMSDDPLYYLQYSPFESLKGCPQKPVCALVNRPEGHALEFFSCYDRDAWVERALYVALPAYDACGGLEMSERCYATAIALCAEAVKLRIKSL